ncbi:SDR family NAD(P)-dependent oxidoreductase [Nocardia sp. CA-120079]|uniref:SDR family NAD(P)-dependent oxidoreductase n=1 Tax=Nocardia sp. CA-120079 TaxID=3239974 RepID=UPI003D961C83
MEKSTYPIPNSSTDLTGQVAVVTGAGSGLGQRFATVLAAAGASVAVVGRREARLAEVASEIVSRGGRCLPVAADITQEDACVSVIDQASQQLGPVSILVNNAGIPDARRPHRIPIDIVDAVINTNFRAPFLLSTEVAKRLIADELPGRIVNISSSTSFYYTGGAAALYSSTKAAINRLTEVLAVEWVKYGINVNAIAPGAFETDMMQGMIDRVGDPSSSFPRKRLGNPAQLDSTLLYLVSPASDMVTGTVIKVDDAQHALGV